MIDIKKFQNETLHCPVDEARRFLGFSWKGLQRATGASDSDVLSWMRGEKTAPVFEKIIVLLVKQMQEMIFNYGMALPSWHEKMKEFIKPDVIQKD